jgi:hypothetical protein
MFEPDDLLLALTNAQIDFVVIGGLAVGVLQVCSLEHLRAMKRAADRPQDQEDLRRLADA